MLLNFLVYITIPVILRYTGILLGIGSFAIYINTIIGLAKKENYFWEQVNLMLYFSFHLLYMYFYMLQLMICFFSLSSLLNRFSTNPRKNEILIFIFDSNAIAKYDFHFFKYYLYNIYHNQNKSNVFYHVFYS